MTYSIDNKDVWIGFGYNKCEYCGKYIVEEQDWCDECKLNNERNDKINDLLND